MLLVLCYTRENNLLSMSHSRIRELCPWPSVWSRANDGYDAHLSHTASVFISDAEIAAVDARLPTGLRLLLKDGDFIESSLITDMLDLWVISSRLELLDGRHVAMTSISDVTIMPQVVVFSGMALSYEVETCTDDACDYVVPTGNVTVNHMVLRDWLDSTYPGWLNRFGIAKDLGLSLTEAVTAMTSLHTHYNAVALPPSLTLE